MLVVASMKMLVSLVRTTNMLIKCSVPVVPVLWVPSPTLLPSKHVILANPLVQLALLLPPYVPYVNHHLNSTKPPASALVLCSTNLMPKTFALLLPTPLCPLSFGC